MLGKPDWPTGRNIAIEFDSEARNYPWFWSVRLEGTADVWAYVANDPTRTSEPYKVPAQLVRHSTDAPLIVISCDRL
jgi:hypothetical protein